MNIHEYFTDSELACPCCNALDLHHVFLNKLYTLRLLLNSPLRISSAYRCTNHNTKVGGSPTSLHKRGEAADILTDTVETRYDIVKFATQLGFTEIIIHHNFVHVGWNLYQPYKLLLETEV